MSKKLTLPDPGRFNLASFAEILPQRDPIIGEDPGSYETFHQGLMQSLAPTTPYECVIAENLIAIEWELLQRRRMREAAIRRHAHVAVTMAAGRQLLAAYQGEVDEKWESHEAAGGTEDDWEETDNFDEDTAWEAGDDLAERALSTDTKIRSAAWEEIQNLGLDPVEVMSEAYTSREGEIQKHDAKVQELERRRREVRRDFDALQKTRPLEGKVIEG